MICKCCNFTYKLQPTYRTCKMLHPVASGIASIHVSTRKWSKQKSNHQVWVCHACVSQLRSGSNFTLVSCQVQTSQPCLLWHTWAEITMITWRLSLPLPQLESQMTHRHQSAYVTLESGNTLTHQRIPNAWGIPGNPHKQELKDALGPKKQGTPCASAAEYYDYIVNVPTPQLKEDTCIRQARKHKMEWSGVEWNGRSSKELSIV